MANNSSVLSRVLSAEERQQVRACLDSEGFQLLWEGMVEHYNASLRQLETGNSVEEVYRAQGAVRFARQIFGLPDHFLPSRRAE